MDQQGGHPVLPGLGDQVSLSFEVPALGEAKVVHYGIVSLAEIGGAQLCDLRFVLARHHGKFPVRLLGDLPEYLELGGVLVPSAWLVGKVEYFLARHRRSQGRCQGEGSQKAKGKEALHGDCPGFNVWLWRKRLRVSAIDDDEGAGRQPALP